MSDNLKFNPETNVLTVGDVEGIEYKISGEVVNARDVEITKKTKVRAFPVPGYSFPKNTPREWIFEPTVLPEPEPEPEKQADSSEEPKPTGDETEKKDSSAEVKPVDAPPAPSKASGSSSTSPSVTPRPTGANPNLS